MNNATQTEAKTFEVGQAFTLGSYVGTVVAVGHGGIRVKWLDGKVEFLHAIDIGRAVRS